MKPIEASDSGSPPVPASSIAQLVSLWLSLNYLVGNWFTTLTLAHSDTGVRTGTGKLHTRMMEHTAKYTQAGKSNRGEIISPQILISYCILFVYWSGNFIPIFLKYYLKLFQLFYGHRNWKFWAFVEESYQDFNLTGQTLLETGAGTDFPLRSFRVILLNLKSSLRFELMKHSHSEY